MQYVGVLLVSTRRRAWCGRSGTVASALDTYQEHFDLLSLRVRQV
jgi:hypothetical protein